MVLDADASLASDLLQRLQPQLRSPHWGALQLRKAVVHAGANLDDAGKKRLQEINKEDASLQAKFQQKLIAGTKAGGLVVSDKAELAGLSDAEIANYRGSSKRGMVRHFVEQSNTPKAQQAKLIGVPGPAQIEALAERNLTGTALGVLEPGQDAGIGVRPGDAVAAPGLLGFLAVLGAIKARLAHHGAAQLVARRRWVDGRVGDLLEGHSPEL